MKNIPKRVLDEKVPGTCLTKYLVDIGELSLCANWDLLNPRAANLSSGVMEKAIIRNINSNGTMSYPCLTSTFLPMMTLNTYLLYMRLIDKHSHGGAPYFPSMTMSNVWLEVSKALTRSDNATHVGRLWLCLKCISVLIVNVPSGHPTPEMDPNCHFTPCLMIILNSRPHMILLYILLLMYIRVTPIQLLGLEVLPLLGKGTTWNSCHLLNSAWLYHN